MINGAAMRKIWIIARKELISTLRQRNLVLIMFLSPLVLSTILGLAFGGVGSDTPEFAEIRVAVVNQDKGVEVSNQVTAADLGLGNFSLNLGNQLAAILLSQPLTSTTVVSDSNGTFNLSNLSCSLLPATESPATEEDASASSGSLDDLFDAVALTDPALARVGVTEGEYAAVVIIPPDFSNHLVPEFGVEGAGEFTGTSAVEVFANNGTPISAGIVRSVVEGIVGRFERSNVALNALTLTLLDRVGSDSSVSLEADLLLDALQTGDASILEPLGCLMMPGSSNIQIRQQPLDDVQAGSPFALLMVVIGGAQAVFFALFTGVFGINSIYEDRIQGTLQRLLVSPTPSSSILAGRLLGNLLIVMTQLLVLLFSLTVITSLVEWEWTFIWGTNIPAFLLVVLGLSVFATSLGALIVGLARTSEQVQLIGPLITILLAALSGAFGFALPRQVAQLSPLWWGLDAMRKLAANESDIGLHLAVLFAIGLLFATAGTFFFRRRIGL